MAVGGTLAFRQASPSTQAKLTTVAQETARRFLGTAPEDRTRLAQAGTSVRTGRALQAIASEVADRAPDWPDLGDPVPALDFLTYHGWIDRLLELPEHDPVWIRNQRGGTGTRRLDVDRAGVIRDWVAGRGLLEIGQAHASQVHDPVFRSEQLADFLTATCENFLPWVLGTVIGWVNSDTDPEGEVEICKELPAFVRYGVDTSSALSLLRAGVLSRTTATDIAAAYAMEGIEMESLREWLRRMSVDEWRGRFGASPTDLRALLQYCRLAGSRLIPDLVAGNEVTVVLDIMEGLAHGVWDATVQTLVGDPDPPRLVVWANEQIAATVPPTLSDDLEATLGLGIPLRVSLDIAQEGATLRLAIDPDVG